MKKNKMTKLAAVVMIIMLAISSYAAADEGMAVGTPVGSILKTDIIAKIDGYVIPSYNIDGSMVIYAKDLRNYGFDVVWDAEKRAVIVNRNEELEFSPMPVAESSTEAVGTKLGDVLYTDIKVYIGDAEIKSYNVNGSTAFYFRDLKQFGTVEWDADDRISALVLSSSETADAYYDSGMYYKDMGLYKLAIQNINKAIISNTDYIDLYLGYYAGSTYYNDFLGLSIDIPETWILQNIEAVKSDKVSSIEAETETANKEAYLENYMPLMAVDEDGSSIITMLVMPVKEDLTGETMKAISDGILEEFKNTYTVGEELKLELGGIEFDGCTISYADENIQTNMHVYYAARNNSVVCLYITYKDAEELDMVMQYLDTLEWSE
ncbi:MAG: hypothetical protein ACOZCL_15480 [Bacillota bacterium]